MITHFSHSPESLKKVRDEFKAVAPDATRETLNDAVTLEVT